MRTKTLLGLGLILVVLTLIAAPSAAQEDPFNATDISNWEFAGSFYSDVWGDGDFAYMGRRGQNRIDVVDISDPANPTFAAEYNTFISGSAQDVKVADGLMFVGIEGASPGAQIVDVRDPFNPVKLTDITVRPAVHNVFYDAGWLYLCDSSTNEFDVIDLRDYDPDNAPAIISEATYAMTNVGFVFVHDIVAQNGRLYVSAWGSTEVYDVTDLDNGPPVNIGAAFGDNHHAAWPTDDGEWLVVTEETFGGRALLYEVTDNGGALTLTQQDTFEIETIRTTSAHNPVMLGDRVYISFYEAGVQVLEIDRANKSFDLVASYDTSALDGTNSFFGGNWGVYPLLGADKVLASDSESGLWILDMTGGGLTLDVTDMVRGEPVTFTVTGGQPGELVRFGGSQVGEGAGPCPPPLAGLCFDIVAPVLNLGSAIVDSAGVAVMESTVPPTAPFDTAYIQAVIERGVGGTASVSSNVEEKQVTD